MNRQEHVCREIVAEATWRQALDCAYRLEALLISALRKGV
jgi:hypothetical protein